MATSARTLRVGTRASALARWQATRVASLLAARGIGASLVPIRTSGDDRPVLPGPGVSGKGLFTKEIEEALLAGEVDLAVHSLKDLPTETPAGLVLAAFPERADIRDALIGAGGSVAGLPARARVGTSSLRRRAALLAARPDLEIVPLRGNVPTRVRRVAAGEIDAAVVALAGLARLGLTEGAVPLDPARHPPAPGQGALGVETRAHDRDVLELIRPLDDQRVRLTVTAERAALQVLEGGCRAAIGAWCEPLGAGAGVVLHVRVSAPDGSRSLDAASPVNPRDPEASGRGAAEELLAAGAAELIRAASPLPPDQAVEP